MQIFKIQIKKNLEESTVHGSKDFPYALYETVLARNVLGWIPLHWHKEFQICLVQKGAVRFSVNNIFMDLEEGDAIFINSQVIHSAKEVASERFNERSSYLCLDFDRRLIGGFTGSLIEKKYVLPLINHSSFDYFVFTKNNPEDAEVLKILKQIHKVQDPKGSANELTLVALLMEFWKKLFLLFRRTEQKGKARRSADFATTRKVITFIEENYSKELSLDKISDSAAVSKSECSRRFKRVTGTTIWNYVLSLRLNRALEALLYSERTVERISFDSGFSNPNIFIRQFKKKFKVSPGKARKEFSVSQRSEQY